MRIALITEIFLPDVNGVTTTLCRLLEHLQATGHEALLLAGTAMLGPLGRYAARQLGLPLVAAYHTDFPAYSAHYGVGCMRSLVYYYLRWVHNSCALTLCPSLATLSDLRAHGFRRLRLWRRGVDTVRFHPRHSSAAWRESIGVRPDETLLLYTGRLATEKRIDLLAEALDGLTGVRLALVGDGPARPVIEQRFAGLPAHFTGFLRGQALATAYASADLFVFPSDTDTFGQVIQEAMASGLPVIAARAGGAQDLVRDDMNGALFTPGSAAQLRAHLRALIADPARRAALGQAGRAAAERNSWSSVMDELLGQYQRILNWRARSWPRNRQPYVIR